MSAGPDDVTLCSKCGHSFKSYQESSIPPSRRADIRLNIAGASVPARRDDLDSLERELKRYDVEISRLNGLVKQLRGQRSEIRDRYNDHISLKAPIRRLPVEILSIIFQAACFVPEQLPNSVVHSDDSKSAMAAMTSSPFAIAAACAFWRQIALGIPSLWNHIWLALDAPVHRFGVLWDTMYSRCSDGPLHVYITMPTSGHGETEWQQNKDELAELIEDPRDKVASIFIFGSSDPLMHWLVSETHDQPLFPNLAVLGFFNRARSHYFPLEGDLDQTGEIPYHWLWPAGLPKMRSLQLHTQGSEHLSLLNGLVSNNRACFSQLTLYVRFNAAVFRGIPSRLDVLNLVIGEADPDVGLNVLYGRTVFHSRSLNISTSNIVPLREDLDRDWLGEFGQVLDHPFLAFSAPGLEVLRIGLTEESKQDHFMDWSRCFTDFSQVSSLNSTLTHLDLRKVTFDRDYDLIAMFKSLSALTRLELEVETYPFVYKFGPRATHQSSEDGDDDSISSPSAMSSVHVPSSSSPSPAVSDAEEVQAPGTIHNLGTMNVMAFLQDQAQNITPSPPMSPAISPRPPAHSGPPPVVLFLRKMAEVQAITEDNPEENGAAPGPLLPRLEYLELNIPDDYYPEHLEALCDMVELRSRPDTPFTRLSSLHVTLSPLPDGEDRAADRTAGQASITRLLTCRYSRELDIHVVDG